MDPNWFNSTLVQSSAAIIGFLGGILITKMVDAQSAIREEKEILEDELYRAKRTKVAELNISNIPVDVTEVEKEKIKALSELVNREQFTSLGRAEKFFERFKDVASSIEDARYTRYSRELGQFENAIRKYRLYQPKQLPRKFVFGFFILAVLAVAGIIHPLTHITGFETDSFWIFVLTIAALFCWVLYLLIEYWRQNKIVIK